MDSGLQPDQARFESSHTDQTISFIDAGLQLQSGSPRVCCALLVCHLRLNPMWKTIKWHHRQASICATAFINSASRFPRTFKASTGQTQHKRFRFHLGYQLFAFLDAL